VKCDFCSQIAATDIRWLKIDAEVWQQAMRPQGNVFGRALGQLDHLRLHARALGQSWIRGLRRAERLHSSG